MNLNRIEETKLILLFQLTSHFLDVFFIIRHYLLFLCSSLSYFFSFGARRETRWDHGDDDGIDDEVVSMTIRTVIMIIVRRDEDEEDRVTSPRSLLVFSHKKGVTSPERFWFSFIRCALLQRRHDHISYTKLISQHKFIPVFTRGVSSFPRTLEFNSISVKSLDVVDAWLYTKAGPYESSQSPSLARSSLLGLFLNRFSPNFQKIQLIYWSVRFPSLERKNSLRREI